MYKNKLKNTYFEINLDTKEYVRKVYGLDKEEILAESLDLLQDWIKKQKHIVGKNLDRNYLESMLIGSKGSIERTKERLDKLCTNKTLMPQYFEDFNVKELTHFGKIFMAPLPKLTKEHTRIFVGRFVGKEFCEQNIHDNHKFIIMEAEFMRTYDYALAYEVVLDYRDCSLTEVLAKSSIMAARDMAIILGEGYGVRVKGIHLILDSKLLDIVVTLAKQIVPSKLADRMHLHRNVDSLHEKLDKKMLPTELEGCGVSMVEICDTLKNIFASEEFREYWRTMIEVRSDETLRSKQKFNEQYMGMPGSFRNLSVD